MGKKTERSKHLFLPISKQEMQERGWDACDFVFVSGDAYVDHPSFAAALLCRVLEAEGYRVGIIPQPEWQNPASYTALGRPRLAFLVGAGNMDSMVAHYTANKRKRSDDAFTPGGKSGARPDRATLVYVEGIRRAYKNAAVIIGGIEASLRRFAHYDYWSDTVRRSILLDSKADILVYGMGEKPLLEIARRLAAGEKISEINNIRGTCVKISSRSGVEPKVRAAQREEFNNIFLPSYSNIKNKDEASLRAYAEHFMIQKQNSDPLTAKTLIEENDGDRFVIQNPPALPLTAKELDRIYELPFTRKAHPVYTANKFNNHREHRETRSFSTHIPEFSPRSSASSVVNDSFGISALKEVSFSLVSSRGCFGGCSFCAIGFHQGRAVVSRSKESLVREAHALAAHPDFKGYIHDVGGPTANFYNGDAGTNKNNAVSNSQICQSKKRGGFCTQRECLFPSPCPKLKADHSAYMETLKALRAIPGIKKVFIRSGVRFDYIQHDKQHGKKFLETLCKYHISGQLKVAPEHVSKKVLEAMGKCPHECYELFRKDFTAVNKKLELKQYLLPYIINSHPGAGLKEADELARYLKKTGFVPEQTQDFYPTPGTMSTVMYHTGLDPRTMQPIYVAKDEKERRKQRDTLAQKH